MIWILSVAGLCIALIALWLAGDALGKLKNQNFEFMQTHVIALKEAIAANDAADKELKKSVLELAAKLKTSDAEVDRLRHDLSALSDDVAAMAREKSGV